MIVRIAWVASLIAAAVSTAHAQDDFIKGKYSTAEGCAALKADKVEEGDFVFLSAKGFEAFEYGCQFVQVLPRKDLPGWVAIAFCEEPGLQYPGLFTIMPLNDSTLAVGTMETGEPEEEDEGAAATPATGETEVDDDGLAGEYQLCPGT